MKLTIRKLARKRDDHFTHSVKLPNLLRVVYVCSIEDARTLANANKTANGWTCPIIEL